MRLRFWGLITSGALLVLIAGAVSTTAIESGLLGEASNSLAWGPALFRGLLALHGIALILTGMIWKWRQPAAENSIQITSPAGQDRAQDTSRIAWAMLIVLSIIALGLRLWQLESCLWYDEVITLLEFVRPPLGQIVTSFHSQNQHIFYSVLAHASISAFGESAWALRLPSVVFGVASLWALFLLGRRMLGAREALLACTLMTFSYHHIWFSQNARGYMGLLFFATLATWLWIEAWFRGAWRWWIYYAVAVALGLWVHMTMVFVVAAHGLVYLIRLIRPSWSIGNNGSPSAHATSRWQPLLALSLAGTVTLQLYALALPEFFQSALHMVSLESEWSNPLWVITESLSSLRIGFAGVAVVIAGGVLVVTGWVSMLRQNWLSGILMILPAVLGGLTMVILGHYLWPRFFFFSMGFVLLILVRGAMIVPRLLLMARVGQQPRERFAAQIGVVLTCFLIVVSLATVPRCYALPKQNFTGARDYVEQRREPGDGVIAVGLAGIAYERYFAPHWSPVQTLAELEKLRNIHANLWLVYTLPIEVRAYHPEIWTSIEKDFKSVKVFPGTLGGGEVIVCRNRPVE